MFVPITSHQLKHSAALSLTKALTSVPVALITTLITSKVNLTLDRGAMELGLCLQVPQPPPLASY